MSVLPLIGFVLLVWVALSVVIALALVVRGGRRRVRHDDGVQASRLDRRLTSYDRRIGLPDTRTVRTERRSGRDRRHGSPAAI